MRRRARIRIGVIAALGVALIVVATVLIGMIVNKINTVTYEDHRFYQYFSGMRFDYDGVLSLRYNGEAVDIGYNGVEVESNFLPIYFVDKNGAVLLPQRMALVIPRNRNETYYAERLSEIDIIQDTINAGDYNDKTINSVPLLKFGEENKVVETPAFLYDGDDTYLFLSDTNVTVAGQRVDLSPLSFVVADYRGDVEIYNYETDEYQIFEAVDDDVMADLGERYRLNLSTDMLLYDDGADSRLLIHNVDALTTRL